MKLLSPFFSYVPPLFSLYGAGGRKCRKGFYPPPRDGNLVVERFAGSAAYSRVFAPGREALLIEIDPVIVSVWEFLLACSRNPRELDALPDDMPDLSELDAPVGALNLMGFWYGRALATPRLRPTRWARLYAQQKPGSFWGPVAKNRIREGLPAIRKWQILRGDARGFGWHLRHLRKTSGLTVFDDPPYSAGQYRRERAPGRHYRFNPWIGGAGDGREARRWYAALALDQDNLARKGDMVIVCEQEGADWRTDFRPCGTARALDGKNGKKRSREVCAVLNGPEGWEA